jgi:predicted DNA-binding transcriptional regulator AlpA
MAASPLGLTAAEVAKRLGKHPMTVYRWAYAGTGPPTFRLAGRRYWPPDELERWLAAQRQLGSAGAKP